MKTIRYYYSPDYRVVNADALIYKDVSIELLEKREKQSFFQELQFVEYMIMIQMNFLLESLDVLQKTNLESLLEEKSRWTERKIIHIQ